VSFSREVSDSRLQRGFSRRHLGRIAAFVMAGAGLPPFNEFAMAQQAETQLNRETRGRRRPLDPDSGPHQLIRWGQSLALRNARPEPPLGSPRRGTTPLCRTPSRTNCAAPTRARETAQALRRSTDETHTCLSDP
jgi:hypothetical protein